MLGNGTSASAGDLHSVAITRADWRWVNPLRGKKSPCQFEAPFKYRDNVLEYPPP